MKPPPSASRRSRATALLPVLIITGMITMVVILFFSLATENFRSSSSHAASYQLSTLRDMAINSVIGQIRQGSTETNAVWISQPGAVRTYVSNTGAPSFIYKLYSNKNMVLAGQGLTTASQLNLENDVPADWDKKPDVYANLNEPAIDATGNMSFPIVDPRALDLAAPGAGTFTPEGFSYSTTLAVNGVSVDGVTLPSGTSSSQRLPMPVQWVYVLQDGSMGVIDSVSRAFVPFSGQSIASASNPIVGRIAFWADDETAKVNVNTASEGLYWDTPRCVTPQEVAFAEQPPVNNEVQRFGGHPATTCLSSIFYPGERLLPTNSDGLAKLKILYDMNPRVSYKDATKLTGLMSANGSTITYLPNVNPVVYATPTTLKRMYASVDEFIFSTPSTGGKRVLQPIFTTKPQLENRLNFFLTAESRAPEVTASGYPRVSIWPVYCDSTLNSAAVNKQYRTSFDNLSAFCATLGQKTDDSLPQPFHFRRSSAQSNENEFANVATAGYVNASNDPMGIGLVSNANLVLYLQELARLPKNGQGGYGYTHSFAEKYDSRTGSPNSKAYNTSTVLLDALEYVRGTNMTDTSTSTAGSRVKPYVSPWGSVWIGSDVTGQVSACDISFYGAPLNTADTMLKDATDQVWTNGIGREFTLSEFGLALVVAAEYQANGNKINPDLVTTLNLPKGTKAIQIAPIFEGFCPGQGYASIEPSSSAIASQLNTIGLVSAVRGTVFPGGPNTASPPLITQASRNATADWGSHDLNVSSLGWLTAYKQSFQTSDANKKSTATWWVPWGGSGGRWMYEDINSTNDSQTGVSNTSGADIDDATRTIISQYSRGYYLIPSTETQLTITSNRTGSGVTGCLEIAYGNQRDGDYSAHRLLVQIPANMVVPVPEAPVKTNLQVSFGKRLQNAQGTPSNRFQDPEVLDANDVVRTWVVRHGDFRLTYARSNEGNATRNASTGFSTANKDKVLFVPHPGWDPSLQHNSGDPKSIKQIHSFTLSGGVPETTPSAATFQRGLVRGVSYATNVTPDFTIDPDATGSRFKANVPSNYPYSVDPTDTRDWDNGTGIAPDGAYWNKADDIAHVADPPSASPTTPPPASSIPPYFSSRVWDGATSQTVNQTTGPNQLMPSAVMFGSINSAPSTGIQWTTLLFRPDITPAPGHLGSKDHSTQGQMTGAPPDHLMLDWFWTPVVQPYAVSEPFSTAGKINMNYRIVPFTNIKRATGLRAVLKSEQILAIPTTAGQTYKDWSKLGQNGNWRHYLDGDETLVQWEDKFNKGNFFINAGEICEQFLVPENSGISGTTTAAVASAMTNYWNQNRLSGDNTLERPYANLYPRLTTRSNTFRVHFLVQTITKARSVDPTKFDSTKDSVTGETQGDALLERSIDPNDPAFQTSNYDYITAAKNGNLSAAKSLNTLYSYRIRNIRHFSR